jgi:uncharacterized OB-fold protein
MSEADAAIAKPLPVLEGLAGEFYGFCKQGELRFQRCGGCGAWRHVPREMCAECGSWDWSWERSSGRGRVFSWTVVARALHPAFQADTPYAAVIVELEEGGRLLTHVSDVPADSLAIDLPVEVTFEAVTPEVMLPLFRRAEARAAAP